MRSKSQARKKLRTPGNRSVSHYWRRSPNRARCAMCRRPLQSIPRLRPVNMRKTDKTARRANRLESGRYCSTCLKNLIRESIWNQ